MIPVAILILILVIVIGAFFKEGIGAGAMGCFIAGVAIVFALVLIAGVAYMGSQATG